MNEFEISVKGCDCGFLSQHQLVWCPSCGEKLKIVKIDGRDYYSKLSEFIKRSHWQWSESRYDPISRDSLIPESENKEP